MTDTRVGRHTSPLMQVRSLVVDVDLHAAHHDTGKVVWWKFCRTEAEALEAVGLSE